MAKLWGSNLAAAGMLLLLQCFADRWQLLEARKQKQTHGKDRRTGQESPAWTGDACGKKRHEQRELRKVAKSSRGKRRI